MAAGRILRQHSFSPDWWIIEFNGVISSYHKDNLVGRELVEGRIIIGPDKAGWAILKDAQGAFFHYNLDTRAAIPFANASDFKKPTCAWQKEGF